MTSKTESHKKVFEDYILLVPYLSQFLDVQTVEERPHACGMTCAAMILQYFGTTTDSLDTLIAKGIKEGGYTPSGWLHEYLVRVFKEYGYEAERREGMQDRDVRDFQKAIHAGNPVIVSVERVLFDRRDFHMIVLTGIRENEEGELEGFFYHDPSSTTRVLHRFVPLAVFYLSWRRMAIFPNGHTA